MAHIELQGICKTFKIMERPNGKFSVLKGAFKRKVKLIKALDNISFCINKGELIGYIGPNGAGKSTTVKIMSGILTPDEGICRIMGLIPWKDRVKHVSRIGVVFGQRSQLWWDVPVNDSFDLLKDIYNVPKKDFSSRLDELVHILDLESLLSTPVRQLSLGQRMRCEIAASLLHSPEILFLDEPTIGLDAVSKLALRDFLKNENKKHGVTMILTTHDMDDIESLCSRVMVIGHGKLLFDGSLNKLKKQYSPLRCIKAALAEDIAGLGLDGAEEIQLSGRTCLVFFDPLKIPSHVMVERLAGQVPLVDIEIVEQDIDNIIASMYREMCL